MAWHWFQNPVDDDLGRLHHARIPDHHGSALHTLCVRAGSLTDTALGTSLHSVQVHSIQVHLMQMHLVQEHSYSLGYPCNKGTWLISQQIWFEILHSWFGMLLFLFLLCLRLKAPEALCFRVVRPSVRSLKYPLLTCTWVRWSTRPTVTVLRHVRPSVRRGFRAFAGERIEGMAWNLTCWCMLTIVRTDMFMAMVCWVF